MFPKANDVTALVLALSLVAPTRAAERIPDAPLLPPGALATFGRMPFHNGARILSSELSPDGKRLATLSARSATVWDTTTGQPLHRFFFPVQAWPGHDRVLAFAPNGKWLAARPTADQIAFWDVTTGQEVKRFSVASSSYARAFCRFTADNSALIVQEKDDVLWISLKTGRRIRHLSGVRTNQLSPDERTFAMVREEQKQVLVGDARTGKILQRLPVAAKSDDRQGVLFLPDGITLAVVDDRTIRDGREFLKKVQFWDLRTGKRRAATWSLPRNDLYDSYRLAISPDGKVLYFPEDHRKNLRRWSLAMRKELPSIALGRIEALHPHPDGKTIISVYLEEIRRRDLTTGATLLGGKNFDWNELTTATSRDGRWLAVAAFDGPLLLWDAETRRGKRIDLGASTGHSLAFSPDGKSLAVNCYDHARLLRVPELTEIKKLRAKVGDGALQLSPDGRLLASLGAELGLLRIFEATTGKEVGSVKGARRALFTPDGKRILVAPWYGGVMRLHEVDKQRVQWEVRVPSDRRDDGPASGRLRPLVTALACSPDGSVLAVAMSGGQVCLLDAATGKERARFLSMPTDVDAGEGRYLHATALAFSANGHWLAVGGEDGFLRIWEVRTCREVHRLHGHEGDVAALAFSADGRRLVSFGTGEGFLWDLQPK